MHPFNLFSGNQSQNPNMTNPHKINLNPTQSITGGVTNPFPNISNTQTTMLNAFNPFASNQKPLDKPIEQNPLSLNNQNLVDKNLLRNPNSNLLEIKTIDNSQGNKDQKKPASIFNLENNYDQKQPASVFDLSGKKNDDQISQNKLISTFNPFQLTNPFPDYNKTGSQTGIANEKEKDKDKLKQEEVAIAFDKKSDTIQQINRNDSNDNKNNQRADNIFNQIKSEFQQDLLENNTLKHDNVKVEEQGNNINDNTKAQGSNTISKNTPPNETKIKSNNDNQVKVTNTNSNTNTIDQNTIKPNEDKSNIAIKTEETVIKEVNKDTDKDKAKSQEKEANNPLDFTLNNLPNAKIEETLTKWKSDLEYQSEKYSNCCERLKNYELQFESEIESISILTNLIQSIQVNSDDTVAQLKDISSKEDELLSQLNFMEQSLQSYSQELTNNNSKDQDKLYNDITELSKKINRIGNTIDDINQRSEPKEDNSNSKTGLNDMYIEEGEMNKVLNEFYNELRKIEYAEQALLTKLNTIERDIDNKKGDFALKKNTHF